MKKPIIAGLACLAAFSMSLPVSAHGQYHCGGQNCDTNYCFIDEDGDGICDNSRCTDENGNAVCGNTDGVCSYFIDENEDGICDHCADLAAYTKNAARSSNTSRSSGHHGGHHGRRHH
ncbi:MAG TPA: hypothetical protein DCZ40_00145 [Lachnospiraceae bacterium]|nr:hypothetical protein [Lachnospiraceae bacterium]